MGQKESKTEDVFNSVVELSAKAMIANKTICSTTVQITQEMRITGYTAQELFLLQNGPQCINCVTKNGPDACKTFCGGILEVSGLTQDATLSYSGSCTQDADAQQKLVADIQNQLKQSIDKKEDGAFKVLGAAIPGNSSETVSTKVNLNQRIEQIFSVNNLLEMTTQLQVSQKMVIEGNVKAQGLRQSVALVVLQEAIQKTTAAQELRADLKTVLAQGIVSETSGLFTNLSSLLKPGNLIPVAVIIVLGVVVYAFVTRKSSGGGGGGGGDNVRYVEYEAPPPRSRSGKRSGSRSGTRRQPRSDSTRSPRSPRSPPSPPSPPSPSKVQLRESSEVTPSTSREPVESKASRTPQ